jgi:hypothetical protein
VHGIRSGLTFTFSLSRGIPACLAFNFSISHDLHNGVTFPFSISRDLHNGVTFPFSAPGGGGDSAVWMSVRGHSGGTPGLSQYGQCHGPADHAHDTLRDSRDTARYVTVGILPGTSQ